MVEVTFKRIGHGSSDYWAACLLRNELLREPLGLDLFEEDLDAEVRCLHLAGFDAKGELVAYLQFKPLDESTAKMLQVAVAAPLQAQGVGRRLVAFAEDAAAGWGFTEIVMHAREAVVGFYQTLGYERVGERFVEVGIPHFKMRKSIG